MKNFDERIYELGVDCTYTPDDDEDFKELLSKINVKYEYDTKEKDDVTYVKFRGTKQNLFKFLNSDHGAPGENAEDIWNEALKSGDLIEYHGVLR